MRYLGTEESLDESLGIPGDTLRYLVIPGCILEIPCGSALFRYPRLCQCPGYLFTIQMQGKSALNAPSNVVFEAVLETVIKQVRISFNSKKLHLWTCTHLAGHTRTALKTKLPQLLIRSHRPMTKCNPSSILRALEADSWLIPCYVIRTPNVVCKLLR